MNKTTVLERIFDGLKRSSADVRKGPSGEVLITLTQGDVTEEWCIDTTVVKSVPRKGIADTDVSGVVVDHTLEKGGKPVPGQHPPQKAVVWEVWIKGHPDVKIEVTSQTWHPAAERAAVKFKTHPSNLRGRIKP